MRFLLLSSRPLLIALLSLQKEFYVAAFVQLPWQTEESEAYYALRIRQV